MFLVFSECNINLSSNLRLKVFYTKSLQSIPLHPPPIEPKKRVRRLSDNCLTVNESDSIPPLPPGIKPKKRVRRLSDDCFTVDNSDSIPPLSLNIIINKEHSLTQTLLNSSFVYSSKPCISETSIHDFPSSTLMVNGGFFPDFFPVVFQYHHQFSSQLMPLQDKYQVMSQILAANISHANNLKLRDH